MATTKITDLTAYTDPVNTDVLPIVDVTSDVTKKVSIANVMKNASLGSAAAPGIAFDGDPNTGIYSPGANQVAITTDGTQRMLIDSAGAVTIAGDLTVNGTTTNINTQNLVVEDKNIVLGDVTTPTDVTADGGGITLKGATDKTINWVDSTDAWTSSERFSYPTGSAAAPTLTFTGDPNTGIYSPGADQVAISTGGSGRLFINSGGQVGIGGSPSLRLDVTATGDDGIRFSTTGTSNSARLELSSGNGTTSGKYAYIKVQNNDANAQGYAFGTFGDDRWVVRDTKANSERLCITSAGLVGVGTSTVEAAHLLQVNGAIASVAGFGNFTALQSAGGTGFRWTLSNDGTFRLQRTTNGFSTVTTPIFFDSSDRVGIGTSSPGSLLHVDSGTSDLFVRMQARGANALESSFLFLTKNSGGTNTGGSIGHDGNTNTLYLTGDTSGGATQHVSIDSTGKVGIGTTTVDVKTQIVRSALTKSWSADQDDVLAVENNVSAAIDLRSGSSNSGYLMFSDGDARARGYVAYSHSSDALLLGAANNERARIDSSGRLLVGTSTSASGTNLAPYSRLQIVGNTAGGSDKRAVLNLAADYAYTGLSADNPIGSISFNDNTGREFAWITGAVDGTTGNNDYPGRLVFSTTADGASSPTERMRIGNAGVINTYTATGDSLNLRNAAAAGTATGLIYGLYGATSTANGTTSFVVWTNGNVQNTNNSYTAISDIKLKENIVNASSQWDDIKALQVRNYNLKEGQTHKQIGLIAQEVELVSPGLVTESPDHDADGNDLGTTTKAVQYSVLYMKAVKALQEAMERIETLEAKVAALEAQ